MTHEMLMNTLSTKMSAEYNGLIDSLRKMSPQEIIDNAYQIVIKQDILLLIEECGLSETQLSRILMLESPVDAIYQEWLEKDYGHMEQLKTCFQDFAENLPRQHDVQRLLACGFDNTFRMSLLRSRLP